MGIKKVFTKDTKDVLLFRQILLTSSIRSVWRIVRSENMHFYIRAQRAKFKLIMHLSMLSPWVPPGNWQGFFCRVGILNIHMHVQWPNYLTFRGKVTLGAEIWHSLVVWKLTLVSLKMSNSPGGYPPPPPILELNINTCINVTKQGECREQAAVHKEAGTERDMLQGLKCSWMNHNFLLTSKKINLNIHLFAPSHSLTDQ